MKTKRFILYSLAFFFLLKSDFFAYMGLFTVLYNLGLVLTLCVVFASMLRIRDNSKLRPLVLASLLFPLIVGIAYGVSLTQSLFSPLLQSIGLTLLIAIGIKRDFPTCIKALALVLEVYAYVNILSVILFPNGLYGTEDDFVYAGKYWFLGYKNVMVRFLLPALFINAVSALYSKGKYTLRTYLLCVVVVATQILVDCMTGLIGVSIMVIMMIVFSRKSLPRYFNLRNGIIAIVLISLSLISLDLMSIFGSEIAGLDREESLSTRQLVWARAGELIMGSPLWGYGLRTSQDYRDLISLSLGWVEFSHPHNYVMYVLMQGGLIGATLIVLIFRKIGMLWAADKSNYGLKMLIAMYVVFLVMGLTESLTGATLLLPLSMTAEGFAKYPVHYLNKGRK